jgi:hypothetical protein
MGRPTKYDETILELAEAYAHDHNKFFPDDVIPTLEALSLVLGISRETVNVWSKDEGKAEFSDIVNRIMAKQARKLINGALRGDLKERTSGMMLGKHGYTVNQQVDHTSSDGTMKPTVIELVGVTSESSATDTE